MLVKLEIMILVCVSYFLLKQVLLVL